MNGLFTLVPGSLVLVFWFLLALDRRRWWPSAHALRLDTGVDVARRAFPDTCVIVPARNEEALVEQCLTSLIAQREDFARLIYVDDRSEDRTGEIARRLVEELPGSASIEVLDGDPTRPGWSGKLHALDRAVSFACAGEGEQKIRWFLFTDADIQHPRGSVRALRAKADEGSFDLVSVMVRLRAESFWERLLIPPFVHFFQLLYPFRRVSDPGSRRAAAAGGCLLVSRELLDRIGGLEAIHGAVIDDVTLARKVRDAGGRLWLGLCPGMESRRGYDGLGEIAAMVSRTAFTQLRHSYLFLTGCLAALALLLVSPPFLCLAGLARGEVAGLVTAAGAWGIQTWTLLPVVRHHGVAGIYALTLPFASAFYMWMTALSAWHHWRGKGARWRGRRLGG